MFNYVLAKQVLIFRLSYRKLIAFSDEHSTILHLPFVAKSVVITKLFLKLADGNV